MKDSEESSNQYHHPHDIVAYIGNRAGFILVKSKVEIKKLTKIMGVNKTQYTK